MVEISWACTMHATKSPYKAKQLSTEKPFGKSTSKCMKYVLHSPYYLKTCLTISGLFTLFMKIHPHLGNLERHMHVVFLYLISSPILIKLKLSCGSVYQGACFGFCQIEQRACVLNKQQHFVFLIWDPRNALTAASSYLKLKKHLNLWSVSIEKCFKEGTSIHSKTIVYIFVSHVYAHAWVKC